MRLDTPACDLARLLGSLVGDDPPLRQAGLQAWQRIVSIPNRELDLIDVFDQSTTLISGINWLQWICLQGRDFGDWTPIIRRLQNLAQRLDFLANHL